MSFDSAAKIGTRSSTWRKEGSRGAEKNSSPFASSFFEDSVHINGERKTEEDLLLDRALFEFCKRDPELKEMIEDRDLYTDPSKMMSFAAHPKILNFFAANPRLKEILDKKVRRLNELYLRTVGSWIFGKTAPSGKTGPASFGSQPDGLGAGAVPFGFLGLQTFWGILLALRVAMTMCAGSLLGSLFGFM